MTGPALNHKIQDVCREISKVPCVERVILFGSRARGDAKERSDVDLAIECPGALVKDWNRILDIVEKANTLLKIDCIRFDTLSKDHPLRLDIENEGEVVYSK